MSEDVKVDSREFATRDDIDRLLGLICSSGAAHEFATEVLRRAAKAWGVTGRKETGYAVTGNNGWTEFYQAGRVLAFPARATLYISDPPKPKASAEERIERALTLLRQNADLITGTTSQVYRTLRGED